MGNGDWRSQEESTTTEYMKYIKYIFNIFCGTLVHLSSWYKLEMAADFDDNIEMIRKRRLSIFFIVVILWFLKCILITKI